MTEKELREQVVSTAQKFVGRREINGGHKEIIDIYNAHKPLARGYKVKYSDAWCATCGSAVAILTDNTDIIPTECGCEEQIKLWKKMGRWVEDDNYRPEPGDWVYYDWQDSGRGDNKGHADHVGIVERVVAGMVIVIEGNKNNAVERRDIAIGGKYIRGYGVPDYASKATPEKSVSEVAREVIAGKWGNNPERKRRLEAAGYDYTLVQAEVNRILKK